MPCWQWSAGRRYGGPPSSPPFVRIRFQLSVILRADRLCELFFFLVLHWKGVSVPVARALRPSVCPHCPHRHRREQGTATSPQNTLDLSVFLSGHAGSEGGGHIRAGVKMEAQSASLEVMTETNLTLAWWTSRGRISPTGFQPPEP